MDKQNQIKNLQDNVDGRNQKNQFDNIKIMILKMESPKGEQVIQEYIEKHFEKYQDEDEVSLLNTFFNKYKTDTKWT